MEILRRNKSGRHRGGDTGKGGTTLKSFGDYALFVGKGRSDRSDGSDAKMDIAFGRSGSEYRNSRRRRFGARVVASGSIVDVRSFVAGMIDHSLLSDQDQKPIGPIGRNDIVRGIGPGPEDTRSLRGVSRLANNMLRKYQLTRSSRVRKRGRSRTTLSPPSDEVSRAISPP